MSVKAGDGFVAGPFQTHGANPVGAQQLPSDWTLGLGFLCRFDRALTGHQNLSFQELSIATVLKQSSTSPQRKGNPNNIPILLLLIVIAPALLMDVLRMFYLKSTHSQLWFKYILKFTALP